MNGLVGLGGVSAFEVAEALRVALARQGIKADVNGGHDLAVVSVWTGLTVWCNDEHFWWRTGWNPQSRRSVYAWHPAVEPERAAHRVAFRYADLRRERLGSPEGLDSAWIDHGPR